MLTQLGEKMSDEEVDELLKGVQVGPYVTYLTLKDIFSDNDMITGMEISITKVL